MATSEPAKSSSKSLSLSPKSGGKSITHYLPFLDWLVHYRRQDLVGDLLGGVIVAIMLVPQGMAYALLAGLPPQVGLYASIVPLSSPAAVRKPRANSTGVRAEHTDGIMAPGASNPTEDSGASEDRTAPSFALSRRSDFVLRHCVLAVGVSGYVSMAG